MRTPSTIVRPPDPSLRDALGLACGFAVARLVLQFALTLWTNHLGYGYFRDEFYYVACGRHLAWGYVDHGPIVALQARASELLFGDSIFGLRMLSAAAGAVAVLLTGMLSWAMGGRRPAQALAMLGVALAPVYLGIDGYLSMNSFEPVFWMLCVFAVLMLERGASPRLWWMTIGLAAGIGMLNKPSMAVYLGSLAVGLLLTPQRRLLYSRWLLVACGIALALVLPYGLWQMHHGWPTIEFLRNGTKYGKNVVLGPMQFLLAQLMQLHPANALVWVAGLIALLRGRRVRNARWLGIAFIVFLLLMMKAHAKDYYLAPAYPALFAAGGVAWEHRLRRSGRVRENRVLAFPVLESVLLLLLLPALPMASPVLAPAAWARYAAALHMRPGTTETARTSILPQFFADRFGWEELVRKVDAAYRSLPAEEQQAACISVDNYGEAGALDFFNRREHLGLPPAISRHNSYWMWGTHGCTGDIAVLFTDDTPAELSKVFESVTVAGELEDPLIMPYEHKRIYIVRHRRPEAKPFDWNDEHTYI